MFEYSNYEGILKQIVGIYDGFMDLAEENMDDEEKENLDIVGGMFNEENMLSQAINVCNQDHELGEYKYEILSIKDLNETISVVKVKEFSNDEWEENTYKVKKIDNKWKLIFE